MFRKLLPLFVAITIFASSVLQLNLVPGTWDPSMGLPAPPDGSVPLLLLLSVITNAHLQYKLA